MSRIHFLFSVSTAAVTYFLASGAFSAPRQTLPDALLDCYQSFLVGVALPELHFDEISIDGDNLRVPRYRIQTISGSVLKVVENPTRHIFRKEYGKSFPELTAERSGRPIFAWREPDGAGGVELLTVNFEDNLLAVVTVPAAGVRVPAGVSVLQCRKAGNK